MIKGIGLDMVNMQEMARFITDKNYSSAFIKHTFTNGEVLAAAKVHNSVEYFATRFAVKEAVFKAVANLLPEKTFDFRLIETINEESGHPYVHIDDKLRPLLEKAGVSMLHLSITTEDNYATAVIIAI